MSRLRYPVTLGVDEVGFGSDGDQGLGQRKRIHRVPQLTPFAESGSLLSSYGLQRVRKIIHNPLEETARRQGRGQKPLHIFHYKDIGLKIGRASCRERV